MNGAKSGIDEFELKANALAYFHRVGRPDLADASRPSADQRH
jgi:hypothetical protein